MNLLLLRLYSRYHIRNDFANVKVIGARKYKKMSEEDKKKSNWLWCYCKIHNNIELLQNR